VKRTLSEEAHKGRLDGGSAQPRSASSESVRVLCPDPVVNDRAPGHGLSSAGSGEKTTLADLIDDEDREYMERIRLRVRVDGDPRDDPKRAKRIRDPKAFKAFHAQQQECLSCGNPHVHAHHLLSRARGGDDVVENLVPLCSICHGVLHDGHPRRGDFGHLFTAVSVRSAISRWLFSEAGEDARWYVTSRLGLEPARAWVEQHFGEVRL